MLIPAHELVVAPPEGLRATFIDLASTLATAAIQARGRFAIAIPGGSVVPTLLAGLEATALPWGLTDVFWCDERGVPPTHVDSNYRASADAWLGAVERTGVRVHRMLGEGPSLDRSAQQYETLLGETLGGGSPPELDLVVLGVGEDGHVCSLFPDDPGLEVTDRWVVAIEDAPKPPRARLTLTLPVVMAARCLVIAAFGASKRDVMRCALEQPTCRLPVARALRGARRAVVLLDDAAASALVSLRHPSGT